jgi:hypothetical protein
VNAKKAAPANDQFPPPPGAPSAESISAGRSVTMAPQPAKPKVRRPLSPGVVRVPTVSFHDRGEDVPMAPGVLGRSKSSTPAPSGSAQPHSPVGESDAQEPAQEPAAEKRRSKADPKPIASRTDVDKKPSNAVKKSSNVVVPQPAVRNDAGDNATTTGRASEVNPNPLVLKSPKLVHSLPPIPVLLEASADKKGEAKDEAATTGNPKVRDHPTTSTAASHAAIPSGDDVSISYVPLEPLMGDGGSERESSAVEPGSEVASLPPAAPTLTHDMPLNNFGVSGFTDEVTTKLTNLQFSLDPATFVPFNSNLNEKVPQERAAKLERILEILGRHRMAVSKNMAFLTLQQKEILVSIAKLKLENLEQEARRRRYEFEVFDEFATPPAAAYIENEELIRKLSERHSSHSTGRELLWRGPEFNPIALQGSAQTVDGAGDTVMNGTSTAGFARDKSIYEELDDSLIDLSFECARQMKAYDEHADGTRDYYRRALERSAGMGSGGNAAPASRTPITSLVNQIESGRLGNDPTNRTPYANSMPSPTMHNPARYGQEPRKPSADYASNPRQWQDGRPPDSRLAPVIPQKRGVSFQVPETNRQGPRSGNSYADGDNKRPRTGDAYDRRKQGVNNDRDPHNAGNRHQQYRDPRDVRDPNNAASRNQQNRDSRYERDPRDPYDAGNRYQHSSGPPPSGPSRTDDRRYPDDRRHSDDRRRSDGRGRPDDRRGQENRRPPTGPSNQYRRLSQNDSRDTYSRRW